MKQGKLKWRLSAGAMCAWLAWVAPVRADETSLSWVRLGGAEQCIAATALAKLVEQRIGRPVLQSPSQAERSIEARIAPHADGGWIAIITVNDRTGRQLGERELRVASGPCSQLDRPASLAISLIIDPNAAGPALMEHGGLSEDAQRLLAQIELPSGDPDALLASLDFTPHAAPAPSVAAQKPEASKPAVKMVSVPDAEWRRVQERARAREATGMSGPTPKWPGYVLLGIGALAVGATVYAVADIQTLRNDAGYTRYRDAVAASNAARPSMTVKDVCAAAGQGWEYDLGASAAKHAASVCDEGNLMQVLVWVFASTAVVSAAFGAGWLLWIADEPAASTDQVQSESLSLVPAGGTSFTGLRLRLQI